MKRIVFISGIFLMILAMLAGCGKTEEQALRTPEPSAQADVSDEMSAEAQASGEPSAEMTAASAEPTDEPEEEPSATPEPTPVPTAEPAPVLTPEPTPTAVPLVAGVYTGSDGSVLTVEPDGSCTYETTVSGTVNNIRAEGRITFHGTVTDGVFTFVRVMYYGLDVTEIARQSGYTDMSYWEQAAAIIYADGIAEN